jgi:hypothetical protein
MRVLHKNATVAIAGKVVHRERINGLGIEFGSLDWSQKAVLESWLEEILDYKCTGAIDVNARTRETLEDR